MGTKHPLWKGGTLAYRGYIFIYSPNHPNKNKDSYMREHRLVAEKALGRYLKEVETVHHNNGKRNDNRNCNLLICTNSYHRWLESKMAYLYKQEHFAHI